MTGASVFRLTVDLDAVARNYLFFKKKLVNGADCSAVVKADAYGLGAAPVSKTLFAQGCRHFFTVHLEEALDVKSVLPSPGIGQDSWIYALNGPCGMGRDFAAAGIVPVLNTLGDLDDWRAEAQRSGRVLPAILHIDTGMNRLGLSAADVEKLAENVDGLSGLDIRYVMSHLACADQPSHPKNAEQLALFKKLSAKLGRPFRYSFANSAGVLLGPDYHFDLARPGCGLYGINPYGTGVNPMQGAVTFEARILQIRDITEPGTVGYGATYSVSPPAQCATISVGYADGYARALQAMGTVVIAGEKCKVIGRVSMDTVVVDTTLIKGKAKAGDMAQIIGPNQLVDDVARQQGTIGYEILTSIGRRVPRIYKSAETL